MSLEELFCDVDDFCRVFLPTWHRQLLTHGDRKRQRSSRLTLSEIMTILIYFHQSQYRRHRSGSRYCPPATRRTRTLTHSAVSLFPWKD